MWVSVDKLSRPLTAVRLIDILDGDYHLSTSNSTCTQPDLPRDVVRTFLKQPQSSDLPFSTAVKGKNHDQWQSDMV